MSKTTAKYCAIVGGILLLIAGITGAATMQKIKEFVETELDIHDSTVNLIFLILIAIAALGGIAVIIGGIFIGKGLKRTGKILILIGVGVSIIGLIITLLIMLTHASTALQIGSSVGFIGILLSILARLLA